MHEVLLTFNQKKCIIEIFSQLPGGIQWILVIKNYGFY